MVICSTGYAIEYSSTSGGDGLAGVDGDWKCWIQRAFFETTFCKAANFPNFHDTIFLGEAQFLNVKFLGKTFFRGLILEQPKSVWFDDSDLSNVSFADTDITRIRLDDKIKYDGMMNLL